MPEERAAFNFNLCLMPRDTQPIASSDCTWHGPLRAVPAHLHKILKSTLLQFFPFKKESTLYIGINVPSYSYFMNLLKVLYVAVIEIYKCTFL